MAGIDWGEGDEVGWEVSVAWEEGGDEHIHKYIIRSRTSVVNYMCNTTATLYRLRLR